MKRILVLTALIIGGLLISVQQAAAQDGGIKVGGGLMFGSGVNGSSDLDNHLGLRLNGVYTIDEQFRAGADIGYFFPDKQGGLKMTVWELDLNGNYVFYNDATNGASAYALAGLNYLNMNVDYDTNSQFGTVSGSDSEAGLNLGVGGEYAVNFGVLYAEMKYVLSNADELVIDAGVRFPIQ